MVAATLIAVVVFVAVAVIRPRWSRSGRRRAADRTVDHAVDRTGVIPKATAGDGYYAPAYAVFPGRCFRFCREPGTGTAFPCDQPVAGVGEFEDPRGNVVTVEACRSHQGTLQRWRAYSGSSDDPAPGGIIGVRAVPEEPGCQI